MEDSLKVILNYLSQWNPSFGYGDNKKDGVVINIVGANQAINRMYGSTEKIVTFTVYCLYDKLVDSFSTANDIYEYLQKNKIIDNSLKILGVFAPTRITMKQNKHLFIVEFQVIGL